MAKFTAGFRKLVVWQHAHALTVSVYKITASFPCDELYGLTSQLRRALSSICAQLAEGSRMPTMVHWKLYYDRAYASAAEVDYFLELAFDLQYLEESAYQSLVNQFNHVSALLNSLSKSCK